MNTWQTVPRIIRGEDIESTLSMARAIDLMREAFTLISNRKIEIPDRLNFLIDQFKGLSLISLSIIPDREIFGIKIDNIYRGNKEKNMPTAYAVYMLYEANTGQLLGMFDADFLTRRRTAAACGLATEIMSDKEASVMCVFGTGFEAISQVEAICTVRPIQKIFVVSRNPEANMDFLNSLPVPENIDVQWLNNSIQLEECDIICTATPSETPLFDSQNLKKKVHINSIGSFTRDMIELPHEFVAEASVVVDKRESALAEAGDLIQAMEKGLITKDHFQTELGELVQTEGNPAKSLKDWTLFKSVGNAFQDLVCAGEIFKSLENTTGRPLNLKP